MDEARTAEIDRQIAQFAAGYPFPLDAFQVEAIRTFLAGDSVMVAAPTGTGKTVVAEYGIYEGVRRNGRVFYTTPIKALSNQKFRDLRATYGEAVGLLTGDISENAGAQIVVMTTEVLRNMLLQTPWELDSVDVVIFDEIHYLADPERGTTWEESIILCPEHIQLVCLSATVSNADEIAAWIGRTHRPIALITHTRRAVPLSLYYFLDGEARLVLDAQGRRVADFPRVGGEVRRRGLRGRTPAGSQAARVEPHANDIIRELRSRQLLPAIYFLFSRRDCERGADFLANLRLDFLPAGGSVEESRAAIEQLIDAHLGQMSPTDRQLGQVQTIVRLARRGIGFHHAGLLPILKQLVEQLFGRGLMQVVFATDTLALGVNMPARSVVVGRLSKWDGQRSRALIPNEFQQMAGRAGRRGMDEEGHVILPYSPYVTFDEALAIATGPLHPVHSAFKIRYNTVLNLWDPPRGERARQVLSQSLAEFQSARRVRELEEELLQAQERLDAVPPGCLIGYDDGDNLLDGYNGVGKSLDAARSRERVIVEELDRASQAGDELPWQVPGRQALRNAFRILAPGSFVHLRDLGWAAYVSRGPNDGVGLFLLLGGVPATGDPERAAAHVPEDQSGAVAPPPPTTPAGAIAPINEAVDANVDANGANSDASKEHAPARIVRVQEYRQIDYLTPRGAWVELPEALFAVQKPVDDIAELLGADELARVRADAAALELPDLDAWAARYRREHAALVRAEQERLEGELAETRARIAELNLARERHVCHVCPVRKEHRDNLRLRERLHRERDDLNDQMVEELRQEDERVRGLIRGIANVLHRFEYLQRGQPTQKADMLAGVFDNNGLIITELLDRGILDELNAADLAEVFFWFAFDREYRGGIGYTLPPYLLNLRERIDDAQRAVLAAERHNGLFISTGYNETFYGALRAWCDGASMARLTENIELSEGDLVLTINKTLDLMRQVRSMLANVLPHHPLRERLAGAERLALRDIVAQSYTFGFLPQSPDTSDAEALNLAAGEAEPEPVEDDEPVLAELDEAESD